MHTSQATPHQSGVGLFEVLVTLLLISTGSLALAQLQLSNLQTVHQSHQQSRHVLLQSEAIERLWQQRCYLVFLDDHARLEYLLGAYPTVFSPDLDDPLSPVNLWQQHRPVVQDC